MISSSVIEFLLILGVHPWGGGGWVHGGGSGYGCVGGVPCTHTHTCTHAHMHMHVKHANHAKHGCLQVGGHLQFLYMYTCVYVRVHACTCVCVCGGTPPMPPDAPDTPTPTCPLPRAAGSPKQQNSISPELIEIIRFCFTDSLPLNIPELIYTIADHPQYPSPTCPTPQSRENPNRKNYNNS